MVQLQEAVSLRSLQYELFAGGQPSKYYPRPTGFDFGDQTRPGLLLFFSKPAGILPKAQRELFYLQLKRVDHSILLFINYNNLDLRLGLCTGFLILLLKTKVSSFHFNGTITITYTLMLGYYLQARAN